VVTRGPFPGGKAPGA